MAPLNLNVLNFVHNFNSNNIIISSTCGFHHCSLREQNVILRQDILPDPFGLTAQNNPVVIDPKEPLQRYLGKHSQHIAIHNFNYC